MALLARLPNEKEASEFMLKAIDFDPTARTVFPQIDSPEDLAEFQIPKSRH